MKVEATPTPGSWKLLDSKMRLCIIDAEEHILVSIGLRPESAAWGICSQTRLKNHQYNRQLRADVRLMVAAPDLLEACKSILTLDELEFGDESLLPKDHPIIKLKRAIAKAKGERL